MSARTSDVRLKVGGAGGREVSPDMWVCAAREGGPGREQEEGGGDWWRRR